MFASCNTSWTFLEIAMHNVPLSHYVDVAYTLIWKFNEFLNFFICIYVQKHENRSSALLLCYHRKILPRLPCVLAFGAFQPTMQKLLFSIDFVALLIFYWQASSFHCISVSSCCYSLTTNHQKLASFWLMKVLPMMEHCCFIKWCNYEQVQQLCSTSLQSAPGGTTMHNA